MRFISVAFLVMVLSCFSYAGPVDDIRQELQELNGVIARKDSSVLLKINRIYLMLKNSKEQMSLEDFHQLGGKFNTLVLQAFKTEVVVSEKKFLGFVRSRETAPLISFEFVMGRIFPRIALRADDFEYLKEALIATSSITEEQEKLSVGIQNTYQLFAAHDFIERGYVVQQNGKVRPSFLDLLKYIQNEKDLILVQEFIHHDYSVSQEITVGRSTRTEKRPSFDRSHLNAVLTENDLAVAVAQIKSGPPVFGNIVEMTRPDGSVIYEKKPSIFKGMGSLGFATSRQIIFSRECGELLLSAPEEPETIFIPGL